MRERKSLSATWKLTTAASPAHRFFRSLASPKNNRRIASVDFIELEDVCKTYRLGQVDLPVLKGVSLRIARGEMVALTGASGSGKTTLMNILGCLDHPTSGKFWLDGQEMTNLNADQRAMARNQKIGFVFQNFNLLSRTSALDNVIMPLTYTAGNLTDRQARLRAEEL